MPDANLDRVGMRSKGAAHGSSALAQEDFPSRRRGRPAVLRGQHWRLDATSVLSFLFIIVATAALPPYAGLALLGGEFIFACGAAVRYSRNNFAAAQNRPKTLRQSPHPLQIAPPASARATSRRRRPGRLLATPLSSLPQQQLLDGAATAAAPPRTTTDPDAPPIYDHSGAAAHFPDALPVPTRSYCASIRHNLLEAAALSPAAAQRPAKRRLLGPATSVPSVLPSGSPPRQAAAPWYSRRALWQALRRQQFRPKPLCTTSFVHDASDASAPLDLQQGHELAGNVPLPPPRSRRRGQSPEARRVPAALWAALWLMRAAGVPSLGRRSGDTWMAEAASRLQRGRGAAHCTIQPTSLPDVLEDVVHPAGASSSACAAAGSDGGEDSDDPLAIRGPPSQTPPAPARAAAPPVRPPASSASAAAGPDPHLLQHAHDQQQLLARAEAIASRLLDPREGHLGVLSGGHLLAQWFHGLAGPEQLQPEHVRQLLAYLLLAVPPSPPALLVPPPPQQQQQQLLPSSQSLPPGGLTATAVPLSSQASAVAPEDVPGLKVLEGQSDQEGLQQQQQQQAPVAAGVWPLRAVYASLRFRAVRATRTTEAAAEADAVVPSTCGAAAAAAGGGGGGDGVVLPGQGQAPRTCDVAVCAPGATPLAASVSLPVGNDPDSTCGTGSSAAGSSSSIDEWTLRMIELVGLPSAAGPATTGVAAAAAAAAEGAVLDAAAHAAATAAGNDAAGSEACPMVTATWGASATGASDNVSASNGHAAATQTNTTRGTTTSSSNCSRGRAPAAPRLLAHTADPLVASYRPLTFYLLMEAVAAATHVALLGMGFRMAGLTPGRTAAVYEWSPRQRQAHGSRGGGGNCGLGIDSGGTGTVQLGSAGERREGHVQDDDVAQGEQQGAQEGEQGVPVVFLHGIGMGLTPYMRLLGRLVAGGGGRRRVLAVQYKHVSMRFTTRIPAPHEVADDVAAFLRDRGVTSVSILAHSYGTLVASALNKLATATATPSSPIAPAPTSANPTDALAIAPSSPSSPSYAPCAPSSSTTPSSSSTPSSPTSPAPLSISRLTLVDPVCFAMFLPHLVRNAIYQQPVTPPQAQDPHPPQQVSRSQEQSKSQPQTEGGSEGSGVGASGSGGGAAQQMLQAPISSAPLLGLSGSGITSSGGVARGEEGMPAGPTAVGPLRAVRRALLRRLLRGLVVAEFHCSVALRRRLDWAAVNLWPSELPDRCTVVLSGRDNLVPVEEVRSILAQRVELLGPDHPHPTVLHYPDHGHGGFLADKEAQVAVLAAALGRTEKQVAGAIAEAAVRAKAASRGSVRAPGEAAAGMVLDGGRWGPRGWRFRRGAKVATSRSGAEDGVDGVGAVAPGQQQQQQRAWFARMWRGGRQVPGRHAHVLDLQECVADGAEGAGAGGSDPWAEGMPYEALEEERAIATDEPVCARGYTEADSPGAGAMEADAAAGGAEVAGTVAAAAEAGEEAGLAGGCGPAGACAPRVAEAWATTAMAPNQPATAAVQLLGVLRALRRVPLGGMLPSGRQRQQHEEAEAGRALGPEVVGVAVGATEDSSGEGGAALRGQSWPSARVAGMHGNGGGQTACGMEEVRPPAGMVELGDEEEPFARAGWPTCGGGEVAANAAQRAHRCARSGYSSGEGVRAAGGNDGLSCPAPSGTRGRAPPIRPPTALCIPSSLPGSPLTSPVGTGSRSLGRNPLASPTRGGLHSVVPGGCVPARGFSSCPGSPDINSHTAVAGPLLGPSGYGVGGRAAVLLAGGKARVRRVASALGARVAAVAAAAAAGVGGGAAAALGGRAGRAHGMAVVPVGRPGVLFG